MCFLVAMNYFESNFTICVSFSFLVAHFSSSNKFNHAFNKSKGNGQKDFSLFSFCHLPKKYPFFLLEIPFDLVNLKKNAIIIILKKGKNKCIYLLCKNDFIEK